MKLHALSVKGFLSFKDFDWEPIDPKLNVIVGPNAAGKSNLFRSVRCIVDALGQSRATWETAGHRGQVGFEIEADFEFDQPLEQRTLGVFQAAAMCEPASIQELYSRSPRLPDVAETLSARQLELSQTLLEAVLAKPPTWLTRIVLNVEYRGASQWVSSATTKSLPRIVAGLEGQFGGSIRSDGATTVSTKNAFLSWWESLDEVLQHDWLEHLGGRRPFPGFPALLHNDVLTYCRVSAPPLYLPTHAELFSLLGLDPNTRVTVDLRTVMSVLLSRAVITTENIRRPVERYFSIDALSQPPAAIDLSNSANLGLYLLREKTGTFSEVSRFSEIARRFTQLTGADVEVIQRRPSPTESAEHPGTAVVEVRTGSDPKVPLEFDGAGIAEALYIAAILSRSGGILLLDEPAANLHPIVQRRLAALLASDLDAQVIASTHSPALVRPQDLNRVSRYYRVGGATVRASASAAWLSDATRAATVEKELRRSSDARAMLFDRGAILVEGESELGSLPVWFNASSHDAIEAHDISLFAVGGDRNFETYARYLKTFEVAFAIVCDGPAIGESGSRCSVARQLSAAGIEVAVESIEQGSFAERRSLLRPYGVFTLASSGRDELEDSEVFAGTVEAVIADVGGKSKVRIAQAVAERCPWPAAGTLVGEAIDYIESMMH